MQKKRSVTPIGHSQYLTGKVATCSGLPHGDAHIDLFWSFRFFDFLNLVALVL